MRIENDGSLCAAIRLEPVMTVGAKKTSERGVARSARSPLSTVMEIVVRASILLLLGLFLTLAGDV